MFDILFGWRKASKCKKLIKKLQCRVKVVKSKRGCLVKLLTQDVAQLLRNGHQQSAFQRVEQLIMDQNIVQVYDLLDHFSEFLILNFSYIRKNRDCPNDINEAVSTLIFSSARLGEMPELVLIRQLFGERYGQLFITTALELLPGNLVHIQIKENLCMKKVSDDSKYTALAEIAQTFNQMGPLLLEYRPDFHQSSSSDNQDICYAVEGLDQEKDLHIDEKESSTQDSSTLLDQQVVYLDDIEELVPPLIKQGNLQDQRLFKFRPFGETRKSSTISRKRTRRRSAMYHEHPTIITDIECMIYYGDLGDTSPDIRRKLHQHRKIRDVNGADSCVYEDNDAVVNRAITMPSERSNERLISDNLNRSSSFPCSHIHPKLPDYDELAAKFMELKKANLQKQTIIIGSGC